MTRWTGVLRHPRIGWLVLALGIAISAGMAHLFERESRRAAHSRFQASAVDTANDVEIRVRAYTDVLYAVRGLFDASERVSRDDFHRFASALSLGERYSGLTNVSYAPRVAAAGKEAFERAVRAEKSPLVAGLPRFAIKPAGEREDYVVLNYVEPMGKNVAAWGLDLLGDPLRRGIVDRARDTGEASAGSGVTLLRDGNASVSSTLMRLAIYRGGGVPATAAERRERFLGVAGSTLRIGELIEAAVSKEVLARLRLSVFDGAGGRLLYDSRPSDPPARSGPFAAHSASYQIAVADQTWHVEMTPLSDPLGWLDRAPAAAILIAGLALTALFFWMTRAMATIGQRNREAELLTALGEDLHSCLTSGEAHQVLAHHMPALLPRTSAVLYGFDGTRATAVARWGSPAAAADAFAVQECQAVRRGHPYHVAASASAINCAHFTGETPAEYICLPLGAQGELIGLLHVQGPADAGLLKAAAQHLALAVANVTLRERLLVQATHDNLTGLHNRHYMQEWLAQELHRAGRHGRGLAAVMLDIDHFKRINDSFGHDAGDAVLREVALKARGMARKSDVVCRYGGEEFLLLMPEASLQTGLAKAEEIRAEVARLGVELEGRPIGQVTLSAGVAVFPDHGRAADTLLRAADEALYAAKEGGRNRVCAAGSTLAPLAA